ncbi:MarR family winged helix-turn-helix transcriptional regulator [Gordonia polyisoprenivorans]|uniref:MarR family winged helix-turn-helix transcriptional regulator n=1 Tax=Gordonia polyisoprenivorans TaxID=84595 RepID=UPI00036D4BD7|nr:MarR family transcriptional regulator [Gordonia polyisoprenivorans]OZC29508.1 MarR family transcriptional regulator [Gordonia polyisoprenivorans]WCB38954.1 MarR family transcriptional regulator [Gordonia polyisoprenivorans]
MPASEPLPYDPIAEAHRQWRRQGWAEVADTMAAFTSVMRAQQIMLAQVDAVLKRHRLTFARYELLALLTFTRDGSLPMAKISSRLQVHPTSVTNVVDRLEGAALVARRPHPTDRRATLVEVTAAGRKVSREATLELNADVFARPHIERADVRRLNRILADYRQAAGDFAAGLQSDSWIDSVN